MRKESKNLDTSGVMVERSVTILRPAADLYRFCRQMENFSRFMTAIEKVSMLDEGRTRWQAAFGGEGKRLEWETEILEDREDELISWASASGAEVAASGSLHFGPAPADRGTEVRMTFRFDLPSDTLGEWLSKMLGEEPGQQVHANLRRLKQLLETGEIPSIEGQPRGKG